MCLFPLPSQLYPLISPSEGDFLSPTPLPACSSTFDSPQIYPPYSCTDFLLSKKRIVPPSPEVGLKIWLKRSVLKLSSRYPAFPSFCLYIPVYFLSHFSFPTRLIAQVEVNRPPRLRPSDLKHSILENDLDERGAGYSNSRVHFDYREATIFPWGSFWHSYLCTGPSKASLWAFSSKDNKRAMVGSRVRFHWHHMPANAYSCTCPGYKYANLIFRPCVIPMFFFLLFWCLHEDSAYTTVSRSCVILIFLGFHHHGDS